MSLAFPSNPSQSTSFDSKTKRLRDRALLFQKARSFFQKKNILEVDCPILSTFASIDAHIDLFSSFCEKNISYYLHSSPEFGMKRLLAEGMGDIYQLSHVFRKEESSSKHNPEFMMAEWYRLDFSLEAMMYETIEFIQLFLGDLPYEIKTYREMFLKATGLDYVESNETQLFNYIKQQGIAFYPSIQEEGKDALLNLILGSQIEPMLGQNGKLTVLAYYPASQAALARKRWHQEEYVAERFEVYQDGVELANGYHELTDAVEQRKRFHEANECRKKLGKNALPIDEFFLEALEKGIPDCSGVAVGFDRLVMLRQKQKHIGSVIAWDWSES